MVNSVFTLYELCNGEDTESEGMETENIVWMCIVNEQEGIGRAPSCLVFGVSTDKGRVSQI